MAFYLRKMASSMAPLAIRAMGVRRNHHSTLFSPLQNILSQKLSKKTTISPLHFSSLAAKQGSDANLLRTIDSEIKCAEESDDHVMVAEIPDGFPFEIQDNPGHQTIFLKREYEGETIQVEVHMPDLVTGDEEDDDNDDGNNDDEKGGQSSIPLIISIFKGDGPCLVFDCTAYPDEVSIESMSVKNQEISEDELAYEGPDFTDLDENLQKALHKYLEIRGIKPSTTNFLHEYMINKDSREYVTWLKKMKDFVAQ
ncbi:uncharacterized protein At2g39795, mitochondrial-like [Tasmannia lanceolata]|uniref:uncharacterized protein At2g39795, mitochondrial-like n=1 Tax=Tasmannia lanceolata TaxID=3420 RepID=UPI004063C851